MRKILFETERLTAGKFLSEDYNDLAEILADPDVTFFEPYPTFTKEACVPEAAKFAQSEEFFVVLLNGKVIGKIWFAKRDAGTYELGYTFHAAFQGKGYASESLRGFLQYVFTQCNVRRVIAEIDSRNVKSVHLAERLGMRREAFHKELFPDKNNPAQYNDFYIYAILQKEFAGAESKGGASV